MPAPCCKLSYKVRNHAGIVFFGSIGSIAETSELQRQAFNEAFTEQGVKAANAARLRVVAYPGENTRLTDVDTTDTITTATLLQDIQRYH